MGLKALNILAEGDCQDVCRLLGIFNKTSLNLDPMRPSKKGRKHFFFLYEYATL